MWKLSYTYKDFVGVAPNNKEIFFKTENALYNYIKSHPTIKVIRYNKSTADFNP
jgi:hypothetical protein